MDYDNANISYNPYKVETEPPKPQPTTASGQPVQPTQPEVVDVRLPPTFKRPINPETEKIFHNALAAMYKCQVSEITLETNGFDKIYKYNGKIVFRDIGRDNTN